MGTYARGQVACMMRIRNEARWIRSILERAFHLVGSIVVLDDGSDDETILECLRAVYQDDALAQEAYEGTRDALSTTGYYVWDVTQTAANVRDVELTPAARVLHVLQSPFRPATARPTQAVSEIRDKNFLWEYCKANVPFLHMLCLDGDELPSRRFMRQFGQAIAALERQVDIMHIPFVYLWDAPGQIRMDGIYGLADDALPRLRFPRLFSIARVSSEQLHIMRFSWEGSKGGFHCGSIPRENFRPNGVDPVAAIYAQPLIHFGYWDGEDRQRKFEFYNRIDPGNTFEGEYRHIIGQPNQHAPGPVVLVPWEDQE